MCEKCAQYVFDLGQRLESTPESERLVLLMGELREYTLRLYKAKNAAQGVSDTVEGAKKLCEEWKEAAVRLNFVAANIYTMASIEANTAFDAQSRLEVGSAEGHMTPAEAQARGAEILGRMSLNGLSGRGSA